jgi:GWxTD domain-containing protein
MKKLLTLLYVMAALISVNALHSEEPQIRLNVDWAAFQYDDEQLMLEIYYDFLQNKITFVNESDKYIGTTLGQLKIFQDAAFINQYAWKNQRMLQTESETRDVGLIVDLVRFNFDPDDYTFRLIIQDIHNQTNVDSLEWSLTLHAPDKENVYLSDVQLATSISQNPEAKDSPFYKNTLVVVPNPSLIFSSDNPALFFYLEMYNMSTALAPNGYKLDYYIADEDGATLDSPRPRSVHKQHAVDPSVEFGMLNVGRLDAGAYLLNVDIKDMNDNRMASVNKKFYIYQKGQIFTEKTASDSAFQYIPNIFMDMDSAQIQYEYETANYLMDRELKSIWESLDNLSGKQQFLFQFWRMRDPDPATEINEYRQEYEKRIEYANANFRSFMRDGWHSDRGRVYIIYGTPSDIERHPNESNLYPHEIWRYDQLEGGVVFVFGDLEGRGDYRLIHSDLMGEIKNYDYMDALSRGRF